MLAGICALAVCAAWQLREAPAPRDTPPAEPH